jgi:hypothetical protein
MVCYSALCELCGWCGSMISFCVMQTLVAPLTVPRHLVVWERDANVARLSGCPTSQSYWTRWNVKTSERRNELHCPCVAQHVVLGYLVNRTPAGVVQ